MVLYTSRRFGQQKNLENLGCSLDIPKKVYNNLDELQMDLDNWMYWYNHERTHSGKFCYGKTPMDTFVDSPALAKSKRLDNSLQTTIEQNNIVCQMK